MKYTFIEYTKLIFVAAVNLWVLYLGYKLYSKGFGKESKQAIVKKEGDLNAK